MTLPDLNQFTPLLKWLGIISGATFMISILLIPWLINKLPPDYFIRGRGRSVTVHQKTRILSFLLIPLRNLFGFILLLAGIAMLFLPGQGILTILLGISLMTFPGKHGLIQRLIDQSSVQQGLNWIRQKTKKPPFVWRKDS
jgi:hypothetical protein